MTKVPVGSRVSRIEWLATPDKYAGPKLFDDLAKAKGYQAGAVIRAELEVTTPDGGYLSLSGGVPSSDTIWRDSTWQDPGVLPAMNARLVTVDGADLVFLNPRGGRWVLIV